MSDLDSQIENHASPRRSLFYAFSFRRRQRRSDKAGCLATVVFDAELRRSEVALERETPSQWPPKSADHLFASLQNGAPNLIGPARRYRSAGAAAYSSRRC
jgi:hypothetical protein